MPDVFGGRPGTSGYGSRRMKRERKRSGGRRRRRRREKETRSSRRKRRRVESGQSLASIFHRLALVEITMGRVGL